MFGSDVLYTNQESCSIWKSESTGEVDVFAEREEDSFNGPAGESQYNIKLSEKSIFSVWCQFTIWTGGEV